ncbi:hypothetical protein QOZ80_8AG0639280 [Eleusine coracana subsp. coracana]|nr:hypothetical protein QOZ80_8AG0639280 [Eleusine coracana subsp. coracana]
MVVATTLLAAVVVAAGASSNDLVTTTCKKSDYATCVAMLGTDPRSARAATVRDLAGIGVDVATDNAWRGSGFFSAAADMAASLALRRCASHYDGAEYALKTASEDMDARLYKHARAEASNAENVGNKCAQEFVDRKTKPSADVVKVNQRMKDWTTVAGDLIDLLVTSLGD